MNYRLLSFVSRSKQRKDIILILNSPKTPTDIASKTKLSVSHVSRTLKEFSKKELVKCVTPKAKIGRVYVLTKKGKEVLRQLK